MSIESQHEHFVSDIRNGRAHAADLVGRYEPFKTSTGCVTHMFIDDDKCSDCALRARERNEDRQVDRFREEVWREQRDYDAEVARDADVQAKKDQERDARSARLWGAAAKDRPAPSGRGSASTPSGGSSGSSGKKPRPSTRYSRTTPITLAEAKRRAREK